MLGFGRATASARVVQMKKPIGPRIAGYNTTTESRPWHCMTWDNKFLLHTYSNMYVLLWE